LIIKMVDGEIIDPKEVARQIKELALEQRIELKKDELEKEIERQKRKENRDERWRIKNTRKGVW